MQSNDYSPPVNPSHNQQRDALQKGLGRARIWARAGVLSEELILDACLHDKRFDTQAEACRGEWLWHLIVESGNRESMRDPIFEALRNLLEEDAEQLCDLAFRYADSGDELFRNRLYEIVEQKPVEDCWYGIDEILPLDGMNAFLFAAKLRGELAGGSGWEWDDIRLIGESTSRFGREQIGKWLETSNDAVIQKFHERWRREEALRGRPTDEHDPIASRTAADVLQAVYDRSNCSWLRRWGKTADDEQLSLVRNALWEEQNPKAIVNLLKALWWRPLPVFDSRLVELCRHPEQEVQIAAYLYLAKHAHPEVRSFALERLAIDPTWMPIGLFVHNYAPGDEELILEAIQLTDNASREHELLYDILQVFEKNPTADCSKLGVVVYGETPCQKCRARAARMLQEQCAAPEWMIEEVQWDAEEVP